VKPIDDNTPTRDEEQLDLLVDNELTEAERRKLLSRLDGQPGGWRQCALAFLEAQQWKRDLRAVARETAPRPPGIPPARRSRRDKSAGTLLAMAASFLVALALGTQWQKVQQARIPTGTKLVGVTPGNAQSAPAPTRPPSPLVAIKAKGRPRSPVGPGAWSPASDKAMRLPVVDGERVNPQWLQNLPAAVPDGVVQAFKQSGHQVRQRRELLPFTLKDGRRLVVPVDEVEVRYVGRPAL
jgi:hypothetical protein